MFNTDGPHVKCGPFRFHFTLVARVGNFKREAVLTALGELLRRRLLIEVMAAYRFNHDKVGQVAYLEI